MSEQEFACFLMGLLETDEASEFLGDATEGDIVSKVCSFTSAGLMTRDHGVVVTLTDGSEFQITVRQSK